jgi:hypothetical protein
MAEWKDPKKNREGTGRSNDIVLKNAKGIAKRGS